MKRKVIYSILFCSLVINQLFSGSYNGVAPQDAPPLLWTTFDPVITKLITSDYFALVAPWSDIRSIPDSDLKGIRQKVFGGSGNTLLTSEDLSTYQDIFSLPATLFDAMGGSEIEASNQNVIRSLYGGYNKNYKTVSGIFIGGTFVRDDSNILKGIKSGAFNHINYIRLTLSEYLIGRLYIAALGFKNSPILNTIYSDNISDAAIINNFIEKAEIMLSQIRYARSAFPLPDIFSQSSAIKSSTSTATQTSGTNSIFGSSKTSSTNLNSSSSSRMSLTSSTLRPIDTFAGIVLINKIPGVQLGTSTNPITYQSAGFISSGECINNWQNLNVDTSNNWYIQRGLRYGGEGAAGAAYLYISQKTSGLVFNTDYSPQDFFMMDQNASASVQAFEAFFKETTPWAFVILCEPGEVVNGQSTTVNCQTLGLIKLNPLLFVKTPVSSNAVRKNGLMIINGNTKNGNLADSNGKVGDTYELTDLWYAPQNLYNETFPASFTDGSPYPYAYLFLQGLYNGYLQTSSYQALVESGALPLSDNATPNNNVNEAMYAQNRWNTPTVEQWLSSDSCLDWKFLRGLLVTYYAGALMYVREEAFRYNEAKKMTYLEEIFMNPEADIEGVFIGNSSDFKYISVLPYPFAVIPNAVSGIQKFVASVDVAVTDLESAQSVVSNLGEIESLITNINTAVSESQSVLTSAQSVSTKANAQNALANAQSSVSKIESLQLKVQSLQIPSNFDQAVQKVQQSISTAEQILQSTEKTVALVSPKDKTNASLVAALSKMSTGQTKIQEIKNGLSQFTDKISSIDQMKKSLVTALEKSRNAISIAQQKENSLSNLTTAVTSQSEAASVTPQKLTSDPLTIQEPVVKQPLKNEPITSSQSVSNVASQSEATSVITQKSTSDPLTIQEPVVKQSLTNEATTSSQSVSNTNSNQNSIVNSVVPVTTSNSNSSSTSSVTNTNSTNSSGSSVVTTNQKSTSSMMGMSVPKLIISSSKKK